ncbi:PAS domain S-box protein [Fodinibius halophilus]|uniref:histidine kinase n=1 Tax=Fodinibius halophilus TaxID=1736908 RepID=A0A6M1T307_9BACT|nr:PAS domain S-box protein [Fodinibius halophilus]NGP87585.1 PAS domain S-box protein [Fodinibius halophilus]
MSSNTEQKRLVELQSFNIVNEETEDTLTGLTELASTICNTPVALINLLDSHQQITKSSNGIDISAIPKEESFCQYAIKNQDLMIVEDTLLDLRFRNSPYIEQGIRFYAGVPLTTEKGYNLGTICVIDNKPRQLTDQQIQSLKLLAREVVDHLELRKKNTQLDARNKRLNNADKFLSNSSDLQIIVDTDSLRILKTTENTHTTLDYEGSLIGQPFADQIIDGPAKRNAIKFLRQSNKKKGTFIAPVETGGEQIIYLEFTFSRFFGRWFVTGKDISEQEKTLRALQETQIKKETILNSASDCIITINQHGEIMQFNSAAEKTFQYDKEEIIGKSMSETLIPPLYREEHAEGIKHYLETGHSPIINKLVEMPALRKDGSQFPIELQVNHIKDSTPPQFLCIFRDISERRETQEKLKKTLTNLNLGQELAEVGSWRWEIGDNTMEWSKKIYDIYDFDIMQKPSVDLLLDRVHPEDNNRVKDLLSSIMEGDLIKDFEHRILAPNGTIKWVRHSIKTIYGPGDKPLEANGAVQDITKQKKTQFKLEREKQLSDKIINSLPISFFMFDRDGNPIRWNDQIREITGYTQQEISYMHPKKFIAEEHRQYVEKALKKVFEKGEVTAEANLKTRDGDNIPHLFSTSSFRSGDRNFFIGTAQNIADLKEYEHQLEISLKEKKVLLSEIHHRVKNNLAIISGLLQLECFNTENDNTKNILANSQLRIQSMATVHEMLYQAQDFSNLSFSDFVSKTIDSIKSIYQQEHSDINFEVSVNDIQLNVNQAIPCGLIINEIVTHAYNNAFPDDKGTITIFLKENGDEVTLHIKDDGKGLPDDFSLSHDNSISFSLINTLVQQLEAEIEVRSEAGSEFVIHFEKKNVKGAGSSLTT